MIVLLCFSLTMFFLVIVDLLLYVLSEAYSSSCPVLECWFVQEKAGRGGGLTAATTQEKSLLYIRKEPHSHSADTQTAPSDISPDRVYFITGEYKLSLSRMCNRMFICVCMRVSVHGAFCIYKFSMLLCGPALSAVHCVWICCKICQILGLKVQLHCHYTIQDCTMRCSCSPLHTTCTENL